MSIASKIMTTIVDGSLEVGDTALAQGSIIVGDASGYGSALSAKTTTQILIGNGTTITSAALSGDATMTNAGVVTIGNDKVGVAKLAAVSGTDGGLFRYTSTANAVTELDLATTKIPIGDGTTVNAYALSGDVTMDNAGAVTIGADKVDVTKMAVTSGTDGGVIGYTSTANAVGEFDMADTKILIGDGTTVAAYALSGDATMTNAGVVTVSDLTLGSDAQGDIAYRGSSDYDRLGKGTPGQRLAQNVGNSPATDDSSAAPVWDSGKIIGMELSSMESADTPLVLDAKDYTARDTAAQAQNLMYCPDGTILAIAAIGDGQTAGPAGGAAGIDLQADQADNEGWEVYSGVDGADGRPMSVGHDSAFFFRCKFKIEDISAVDDLFVGFRKHEALNGTMTSYTDYFGLGLDTGADPGDVKVREELNNAAGASTDTNDNLADATDVEFAIYVSSAGVATVKHDIATPGTLAAPTATSTFTFDDGDQIIPIFRFIQDANLSGYVLLKEWKVGFGSPS
jgi:hypothetical protein